MKLPNLPFLQNKKSAEYLLVLLLRQEKANAVIIEKSNSSIKILNQHEEFFSSNLEDAPNEEWLDILDTAISRAEETLPPNIETHQTVFGLPNYWVEDKQIKKEYLSKLKHASSELDLKPIGFIEIPEAIIHEIAEKEGAPVSALIIEIGKHHVVVSLSRAGRILDTKSRSISETPVGTVDELLKTFQVEVLPSRLIIYNGDQIDGLSQAFTTHQFSRSIPFLHMPNVTILDKGFDVQAVVKGAAEQLGVSLAGTFSGTSSPQMKTLSTGHKPAPQTTETIQNGAEGLTKASAEELGFVIGKDISDIPEEETKEAKDPDIQTEVNTTHEVQDDVKDPESEILQHVEQETDFKTEDNDESPFPKKTAHSNMQEPNFDVPQDEPMQTSGRKKFAFPHISFPLTLPVLSRFFPGNHRLPNKLFLLIPFVLILLIAGVFLYITMVKATIEVTVRPEIAEDEVDIVFTTTGPSDFSENILQAKTTTLKLSGKSTTNATGEEEIGEKATGTVTIFNSSTSKKELPEGTVITSSNDLDFALDKIVIIASASGDIFAGIQSGTAKVPVTASGIGKEYNIPSGTTFTIGSDSTLGARNEEAFSGGSKEEVTVVSKNDIAKLTKDLPNSLQKTAEDQLSQRLGKREVLLTAYTEFTPSDKAFSATEGDEADTVTLESVVEFTGVFYDNSELIEFTKSRIKQEFAQDLTVDESGIRNTLSDIEENDENEYSASLAIEADLLPKIDIEKLKEEFKGKSFDEVNRQFERLPQVINTHISLFPPVPFLPQIMPRRSENIEIIVTTNE